MYNAHIIIDNGHEIIGWETGFMVENNETITTLCLCRAIKVGHVWYGLKTVQTPAPGLEDDDWDKGDGLALSLNDIAYPVVVERLGKDYENALAYVKGDVCDIDEIPDDLVIL